MYIDYRELNKLQGYKFYSKFYLRSGYHQLRIQEEDIQKTAFGSRYSHYEFVVLPLGLTNAPTVFMDLLNRVCKPYLDKLVLVFTDNTLIYSQVEVEHGQHLRIILEFLRRQKLYTQLSKCEFWITEVHFLGHVIRSKGIHVVPSNIKATKNWEAPTRLTDVH